MDFIAIIPLVIKGATFTRTSDKHSKLPWRIVNGKSLDVKALKLELSKLHVGQMLGVPGLERQQSNGSWVLVGGLMSHQALANDWKLG